jgi:hypothetical protein
MTVSLAQVGGVALVAATAAYVGALARLRALEAKRGRAPGWWFGYARDGTNLAASGTLFLAFVAAGFGGPAALVLGCGLTLGIYLADWIAGRWLGWRAAPVIVLAAALSVAAGVLARQAEVAAALDATLAAVAPG